MAGPVYSSRVVAGGDEGSDSDDWDIGVVRQEPQVGLSLGLPAGGGAPRLGAVRGAERGGAWGRARLGIPLGLFPAGGMLVCPPSSK